MEFIFIYLFIFCRCICQIFYHFESDIEFYRVHIDSKGKGAFWYFSQWYKDNWHPTGTLCQTFRHRIIYDAASSFDAKVDNVLRNEEW